MIGLLLRLVILLGVLVSAGTWFDDSHWLLSCLAHGRVQASALFGLLGFATLAFPARASLCLAALGFVLNATPVLLLHRPPPALADHENREIRVATVNLYCNNGAPREALEAIHALDAEILVLTEYTDVWHELFLEYRRRHPARFPFGTHRGRPGVLGIAIWSRWPLTLERDIALTERGQDSIRAEIDTGRGPLRVLGTHFFIGLGPWISEYQDRQARRLPSHLPRDEIPTLVVGDFNLTPFSGRFRRLLIDTGLRDSTRGHGWQPTYPSVRRWNSVAIDHILHSPSMEVRRRRTVSIPGSDHRGVVCDFVY
jgi:endonuclease/exonuclease/phosphatase (EEP) superfamily protein YafD